MFLIFFRSKSCHSWVKDSHRLVEDGHGWRKYGQKKILNAKYPRNYYRCTHKFEQNCQATKHIQRLDPYHDPPKFRTTYYGHHTCTPPASNADIFLGGGEDHDVSAAGGGFLLSFCNPVPQQQQVVIGGSTSIDTDGGDSLISDYIAAGGGASPEFFSEVMMMSGGGNYGSGLQFEDDVLSFQF